MCMRMLTLNEADNKETLLHYSLTLTVHNYSLIVAGLFHVLSFQYCLSMVNWSVPIHAITGYENITATNNEVEC